MARKDASRPDAERLYVGQSGKTLLRHNDVRTSVASIEFENTVNGTAYGNYAHDNTAGMLIFKDMTQLDFTGPYEVFSQMPGCEVRDIAATLQPVAARGGLNSSLPKLSAFLQRIHARPAYQRALERGGPYELLR